MIMNSKVFYIILICTMVSKVISILDRNPLDFALDFELDGQQNKEDIHETSNRLKDLATYTNFQKILSFLEPVQTPKSLDKETKSFQDVFSSDSNGLIETKTLDYHQMIDEVFKSLQDLLFTDEYNAQVESKGPTDKQITSQKNRNIKKGQRYLKMIREIVEQLNSSDSFLFNGETKSLVSGQGIALDQRILQSNTKQRYARDLKKEANMSFQEALLNVTARAARHGYEAREYTVQTDDGYILGLHRIQKRQRENGGKRVPVLLMHGLLLSSACWLDAGPGTGLAYLLAQDGHDVWLGNARGNYYSRAHAFIDPGSSSYWQFSADEHGKYDLPAMIDTVLNETGAEKLNYLGYSQGGGTYFIMCSELPHYCDKAKVMVAIAPSGRHLLTKSLAFRLLCEFCEKNEKALFQVGLYEMLPKNGLVQKAFSFFCRRSNLTFPFCELVTDLLDSHHSGSITKKSMLKMAANFPSGTSVHNLARYSQTLRSRSIYKFDYGPEKNFQLYGSSNPPLYNLSSVTVPIVVIYGRNDGIVDIDDVKWLIQRLPNVIEAFEVEDPLWTHLDSVYSQYVPKVLYPKIKEYLN